MDVKSLTSAQQKSALNTFMLSASGWRKKFIPAKSNAQHKSSPPHLNPLDTGLMTTAFLSILNFYNCLATKSTVHSNLIFAKDSRPSGEPLSNLFLALASSKTITDDQGNTLPNRLKIKSLGTTSLPQTLSYVAQNAKTVGFVYLTASHNPAEYNGIKFGLSDGKILNSENSYALKHNFLCRLQSPQHNKDITQVKRYLRIHTPNMNKLHAKAEANHYAASEKSYIQLMQRILSNEKIGSAAFKHAIAAFKKSALAANIKVLLNYNGSSRIRSADAALLTTLGISAIPYNATLSEFTHDIVPEGKALQVVAHAMEKYEATIGLAFDCDGDRGNLVIATPNGKMEVLGAQFSFSLAVISQIAFILKKTTLENVAEKNTPNAKAKSKNIAIIANDATSISFENIASRFGVKAYRVEVGEANLLKLKLLKEAEKFQVPIVGEGSNGGNIINYHTVRDPMATLLCALRLALDEHTFQLATKKLNIKATEITHNKNLQQKALQRLADFESIRKSTICTEVFEKQALLPATKLKEISFQQLLRKFTSVVASGGIAQLNTLCQSYLEQYYSCASEATKVKIEKNEKVPLQKKVSLVVKTVYSFGIRRTSSLQQIPKSLKNCGVSLYLYAHLQTEKKLPTSTGRNKTGTTVKAPFALLWFRPSATEPVIRVSAELQILKNVAKKNSKEAKALQKKLLTWLRHTLMHLLNNNESQNE